MFRSRVVVATVAATLLAACAAACSAVVSTPHVTMLGPWPVGGPEAEQLRSALDAFEQDNDVKVDYTGSPAVAEVLQSDVQKGTPPDIAVLPSPGDVAVYQDQLAPLDTIAGPGWTQAYSRQWQQLARAGLPKLYAVPIRANLKGLYWYDRAHPPNPVPRSLTDLSTVDSWCLGVAAQATSGWPGTDWIEDILLHQSGVDVYQKWVAGRLPWRSSQVQRAWTTWGGLVTGKGQVLGGPTAALLTDYADAARPMFAAKPGCAVEHQASFMSAFYSAYDGNPTPGKDFDYFALPGAALPVSADLAGVFNDTPQAQGLIRFLVSQQAQEHWPAVQAFSANEDVPVSEYLDPVSTRIATQLTGATPLCFDASDLMPAIMRGAFYRAVLSYLGDPASLPTVLGELDQVRTHVAADQWLKVACGG